MTKKVPQRRNKLAGTGTASSAKKRAYDTKFSSSPEQKAKRAATNRANRLSPNKKGQDKSHTKSGRLVNESQAKNRARQGKGGRSTKK
jgi:hypothetical protein